jgi:hypothetical protein
MRSERHHQHTRKQTKQHTHKETKQNARKPTFTYKKHHTYTYTFSYLKLSNGFMSSTQDCWLDAIRHPGRLLGTQSLFCKEENTQMSVLGKKGQRWILESETPMNPPNKRM